MSPLLMKLPPCGKNLNVFPEMIPIVWLVSKSISSKILFTVQFRIDLSLSFCKFDLFLCTTADIVASSIHLIQTNHIQLKCYATRLCLDKLYTLKRVRLRYMFIRNVNSNFHR